jgi:hypothetical protein
MYYCSQNVADASCALSIDGGNTFLTASQMYTSVNCFGLHGHVRVGPDGAVYVPNKACGAPECNIVTPARSLDCHKGLAVSLDNATTWNVYTIPDSFVKETGNSDPAVGIGKNNTIYYGYDDRSGHPKVTVSRDHGVSWTHSIDVGKNFHIENSQFGAMVAGDDNRAAFSFIGTSTPGNDQDPGFAGVWYLYVSYTYDGGQTWTTLNVTPNDPVQRGCVQVGSACGRRNMLDFNGMTIDKTGRVLIAWTDGCADKCETDPKNTTVSRVAAVSRQTCGLGLIAAYDPGYQSYCYSGPAGPAAAPEAAPLPTAVPLPPTTRGPSGTAVALLAVGLLLGFGIRAIARHGG